MVWLETSYSIPLAVATAALALSALYIWLRSLLPGAKAGALLMLMGTVWMAGFAVEVVGADLSVKAFGDKLQFSAMAAVSVIWLVYVFQFAGLEKWITRRNLVLLSLIPAAVIGLAFTNSYHGLIWGHIALSNGEPTILYKTHNIGYWGFLVYSYVVVLFGSVQLIQVLLHSRHLYREQGKMLFFAAFVPLFGGILYMYGINPLMPFSLGRMAVTVVVLIMAWGIARMKLEDIAPVVHGTIIESMSDSVIVLDGQNRIRDLNPSARQLLECTSDVSGQPIEAVWPGSIDFIDMIREGETKEITVDVENEQRTYDMRSSSLVDWRGRITHRIIVARDITERRKAEEQIKASLREKEVLLQEIHHRVKNNLQIVSSLLNLQSSYIKDKKYANMFKESRNRIQTMALIHEKLYKSENLAEIDFREYVRTLISVLFHSHGVTTHKVEPKIEIEDVLLSVDTAIPCGLIINELVSNCLKHAFPGDRKGEITIGLRAVNGALELLVSDNGVGLPDDIDFKNTETLGLRLVTILAEDQLKGKILVDRRNGTAFRITFERY